MKTGLLGFVLLSSCVLSLPLGAQETRLPWGQSSDLVAWEEFAAITASSGNPADKKAEFETWASDEDIYVKSPAHWPSGDEPKLLQASVLGRAHGGAAPIRPQVFPSGGCAPPGGLSGAGAGSGFPVNGCIGEEVRRNWASFQYVVSNGLDSRAGMARAFAAKLKVEMPADAVEFKGDWAPVADTAKWLKVDPAVVRSHYYTSTSTDAAGNKTEVALLSFHISSKQIKNWVWSDFEGAMNSGRCDVIGCHDSFGAAVASVAPNAKPYAGYGDCGKSPALKALLDNAGTDPVWRNYCLKASQIAFVDKAGKPILLGNSVIEPVNADVPIAKSSCISCHAYASFNAAGKGNIAALSLNAVGNIDAKNMTGFLANDFVWSPAVNVKAK